MKRRIAAAMMVFGALVLSGCSGGGGGDASPSAPSNDGSSAPAESPSASPAEEPTGAGAQVDLHVSGSATIDFTGAVPDAICAYMIPADSSGVAIAASGSDAAAGDWSMHLQGSTLSDVGLLLAIGDAQYSGNNGDDPATLDQGGTITVSDDVQHATFDMQLVNIINHEETIHATGSVDCG